MFIFQIVKLKQMYIERIIGLVINYYPIIGREPRGRGKLGIFCFADITRNFLMYYVINITSHNKKSDSPHMQRLYNDWALQVS